MNISATYDYSPGIIQTGLRDISAETPSRPPSDKSWLPVPLEPETGQKNQYKYYVADKSKETVYNRAKTTEKIYLPSGSLIDIYV